MAAPIAADIPHAVTGHATAVRCLLQMHDFGADAVDATLGFDRTVFVPSAPLSLAQLAAAVRAVVHADSLGALGAVTYEPNAALSAAVRSFPVKVDCGRALALGMSAELTAEQLVRDYARDFPDALAPGLRLRDRSGGGVS